MSAVGQAVDFGAGVRRVFDGLEASTGRVVRIRRFRKGYSHHSWAVTCANGRFVAKIPRQRVGHEYATGVASAMRLARTQGAPCPEVVHVEPCATDLGGAALLIHEFVDGRDAEATWESMTVAARQAMLRSLGRAVGLLHEPCEVPFQPRIGGGAHYPAWGQLAAAMWETNALDASHLRSLDSATLGRATEAMGCALERLSATIPAGLAHRDLHLANVLTRGRREPLAALIDFEYAGLFDPMFDFVKLRMWLFDRYGGSEAAFMDGYNEVRGLPPDAALRIWVCDGIELLFGLNLWRRIGVSTIHMARDYLLRFHGWLARGREATTPASSVASWV